ncbi:MAG: flagellin FliC3 [Lachnospiraceae bacterium]|nr:flagellin FliC3 [Lachnospiraceae bacterium]
MKINYNVSAMIANNSLKLNDNRLTKSLERLSSGYKINSAKDNAAGLAISRRMNAQLKGLKAASQDAKDGVSVVEIADGALAEIHDILQRMNELAVKSSNGTLAEEDRAFIEEEIQALAEEIDRIGETTEYNGQKLFTGEFDLKGYTNNIDIKVDSYSDSIQAGEYDLQLSALTFDKDGNLASVNGMADKSIAVTRYDGISTNYQVKGDTYHLTFSGPDGDEFKLDTYGLMKNKMTSMTDADGNVLYNYAAAGADAAVRLNLTGYGPMTFQIGANENQTIDIRISKVSLESLGFKNQDTDEIKDMKLTLATADDANNAISLISSAITQISALRSRMGAYENRLEHTQTNLDTSDENMTSAYSRIMDTDMADEMTQYSNLQVISQAATSILAQANQRPSQMLQLLQ